jgi:alpha-N-arabinofuranosidase
LLDFSPQTERDIAGIVLRQNEGFSLQLLVSLDGSGRRVARAVRRFAGVNEVVSVQVVANGPLLLSVTGEGLAYHLAVNGVPLATLDGRGLSTSLAGGFTGTMLGPYCHRRPNPGSSGDSDDRGVTPVAYWDWFEYQPGLST